MSPRECDCFENLNILREPRCGSNRMYLLLLLQSLGSCTSSVVSRLVLSNNSRHCLRPSIHRSIVRSIPVSGVLPCSLIPFTLPWSVSFSNLSCLLFIRLKTRKVLCLTRAENRFWILSSSVIPVLIHKHISKPSCAFYSWSLPSTYVMYVFICLYF